MNEDLPWLNSNVKGRIQDVEAGTGDQEEFRDVVSACRYRVSKVKNLCGVEYGEGHEGQQEASVSISAAQRSRRAKWAHW